MAWDWEKLKEQQRQTGGGGIPPQVDEIVKKFKGFKLPGGPIIIIIIIILFFATSTFYTVK